MVGKGKTMIEIWKDINGYEGFYQVSNLGRVRSLDRYVLNKFIKGKILSQRLKENYSIVHLCMNGTYKNKQVHRLVAEAFIPNTYNLPCVNHKDENPSNNNVENLEWCTVKYNTNYGNAIKKRAEKRKGKKMPKDAVDKIAIKHKKKIGAFKYGKLVKVYDSAADANRENPNYKFMSISACCNGRIKTYRGFEWKFINN